MHATSERVEQTLSSFLFLVYTIREEHSHYNGKGVIYMKNFNVVVVENGNDICFGNDVSAVEIKDNELVCAYDDGEREEVYNLDHAKSVIVEINR